MSQVRQKKKKGGEYKKARKYNPFEGMKQKRLIKYTPNKEYLKAIKEAKMAKPRPAKSIARKLVGKVGAKAIPGVGGAMIAYDVMKAGAKKRCVEKGGKVKGNRCFMPKKTRVKSKGPDPRFSRTRRKK